MLEINVKNDDLKFYNHCHKQYYSNKLYESHNIVSKLILILLEPIYMMYLYVLSQSNILGSVFNSNARRINTGFIVTTISIVFFALYVQYLNQNYNAILLTSGFLLYMIYLLFKELIDGKKYPIEQETEVKEKGIKEREEEHFELPESFKD